MKLDWESIKVWIKEHRNILIISGLIFILILFVLFLFQECSDYSDRKELDRLNKGVNKFDDLAANANAEISNLKLQNANQQALVNQQGINYNEAKNGSNGARTQTNEALENINRFKNTNFNNTNLSEAQKARCLAYPESCR